VENWSRENSCAATFGLKNYALLDDENKLSLIVRARTAASVKSASGTHLQMSDVGNWHGFSAQLVAWRGNCALA
jgi:hypothetical protein